MQGKGMIHFIADLHLGHKNIINYCERPFDTVHEMNKTIIEQINNVVQFDDELYILGDFCFKGKKPIDYRSQINCQKVHLILGNHDKRKDYEDDLQGFSSVQDVKEIIYCNQRIFLSHYPHRSWPASHKGSFHLYGHVHSKLNHEDAASNRKTLDVGVDNCVNYKKPFGEPWSFKEIQKLFSKK
jgi:calcineurin-like phosphoesterase family protein